LPLLTAVILALGQFVYPSIIDTYVVPFVPLLIFALARELRHLPWLKASVCVSALLLFASLAYSACWLRGRLESATALWSLADRILALGVPADRIAGGYHWDGYHGAFDDWLAESKAMQNLPAYVGHYKVEKAYRSFVARRYDSATYRFTDGHSPVEPGWRPIDQASFRDSLFRLQHVQALKKEDGG